uniref:Nucleotide-diphospho-sugar transferase domain-containing protein n=1 Tax=Caenorhabditis japonica TaxID=281687 RepID=A0A8R1DXE7_CAEJA
MSTCRIKYSILSTHEPRKIGKFLCAVLFVTLCLLYLFLSLRIDKLSDLIPFKLPANLDGKPANVDHRIAIVMVVTNDTKIENYDIAIQSVRCYSRIHNYEFILAVDTDFNCEHKDKFFRRHCVSAKILPLFDAIAFLDADIGIINPKRKIEEYMQDGIDIVFYDRFYNWEVMAGSYIAKNTQYAIDLLNAEKLFPNARIQMEICQKVYNKSKDYDDLFTYEACIRAIWGTGTDFGKGTGWARDGWLTSMVWNEELDFMIHEWKTKQLRETPDVATMEPKRMGRNHWYNPLAGPIHLLKCSPQNMTWSYDPRLLGDKQEILKGLEKFEKEVAMDQVNSYSRMTSMLSR